MATPLSDQTPANPLEAILAAARTGEGRAAPPVHLWNPPHCGEIDIRIARNGLWFHEGTPIGREALVRLFASVLRKDPDGYHLVTPVEKMKIAVEDAPFIAVRVDRVGESLVIPCASGAMLEPASPSPMCTSAGGWRRVCPARFFMSWWRWPSLGKPRTARVSRSFRTASGSPSPRRGRGFEYRTRRAARRA